MAIGASLTKERCQQNRVLPLSTFSRKVGRCKMLDLDGGGDGKWQTVEEAYGLLSAGRQHTARAVESGLWGGGRGGGVHGRVAVWSLHCEARSRTSSCSHTLPAPEDTAWAAHGVRPLTPLCV